MKLLTADALKSRSQTRAWPYIVLIVGMGIGSTGPIMIRLAQSEGISSLAIVALRQIFATIFLTPLIVRNYRHELHMLALRDLMFAALTGTILAVRFLFLFEAFNNASVLITGVLGGTGPLWVALVEIAFLKATFDRRLWLGLLLALIGGVIVALAGFDSGASLGSNPALGAAYALAGAFLSAFYLNMGRSIRARVSFWPYLWLIFLFAAIASFIACAASGTPLTGYSTQGYVWLVLLTITAQFFGHGSTNYALAYISATVVSISAQLGTIESAILAYFAFDEQPGLPQLIGSVIILGGVIIAIISGRSRPADVTRPED